MESTHPSAFSGWCCWQGQGNATHFPFLAFKSISKVCGRLPPRLSAQGDLKPTPQPSFTPYRAAGSAPALRSPGTRHGPVSHGSVGSDTDVCCTLRFSLQLHAACPKQEASGCKACLFPSAVEIS